MRLVFRACLPASASSIRSFLLMLFAQMLAQSIDQDTSRSPTPNRNIVLLCSFLVAQIRKALEMPTSLQLISPHLSPLSSTWLSCLSTYLPTSLRLPPNTSCLCHLLRLWQNMLTNQDFRSLTPKWDIVLERPFLTVKNISALSHLMLD